MNEPAAKAKEKTSRSSTSPTEKGWEWLKSEMARTTGRGPPGVAASLQERSQRRSSGSAVRKPASTWLSVSEETKTPYDAHTSEKRTSPRYPATSGSRGKGCTWYTQAG